MRTFTVVVIAHISNCLGIIIMSHKNWKLQNLILHKLKQATLMGVVHECSLCYYSFTLALSLGPTQFFNVPVGIDLIVPRQDVHSKAYL